MFKPCAVIPTCNHVSALPTIIERLQALGLTVWVVDDGSNPEPAAALDQLAAGNPQLRLLRHASNQGKGAAVISGLKAAAAAGFTHALQVDADGQHDLHDAPALLTAAAAKPAAMVTGIPRYDASVPRHRYYARYLTHVWVWIETLSLELRDTMCGFRVYPLAACVALFAASRIGRRMDFDTEVMVRLYWQGLEVVQLPTKVTYPAGGFSNFRALEDNLRISAMHTRLFFGMLWRSPMLLWRRLRGRGQHHWSVTGERGSYWGLKLMLLGYRHGGRGLARLLLYPVLAYFFVTGSRARAASRDYLQRLAQFAPAALPGGASLTNQWRHFLSFGQASLLRLDGWCGKLQRQQVNFPDHPQLSALVASGRGAVVVVSHVGHLELCRALAEEHFQQRINVLVMTEHAANFNRVLAEVNPASQLNLIHLGEVTPATAVQLAERIERGELLMIAGDRTAVTSYARVHYAPFLGAPAPFAAGPYILAALLHCPLYLLSCWQSGADQFEMRFSLLAEDLTGPRRQRDARLAEACEAYVRQLEALCLKAPLQWFNFFDFWRPDHASAVIKKVKQ